MKKAVLVSLLAFVISVCAASVTTAKGNHAMTITRQLMTNGSYIG